MQKALGIVIGLTIPLVGAFSFAYADSVVTGNLPATSTLLSTLTIPGNSLPNNRVGQSFVSPVDTTVSSVSFALQTAVLGGDFTAFLYEVTGGVATILATSTSITTPGTQPVVANFSFSSPPSILTGHTYIAAIRYNYNAAPAFYGIRSNVYNNGCVISSFTNGSSVTCDTTYDANGSDAYFAVYGTSNTNSRIISISSPQQQSYSTNSLFFSYTYFSGYPVVASANVQIRDLTLAQSVDTSSYVSTTTSSGTLSYQKSITLSASHSYQWRAVLVTSSGNQYSDWRLFDTGQLAPVPGASSTLDYVSSFFQGSIIGEALNGDNFGTINDTNSGSSTQTGINAFQNVASYLSNRVPIGYIWDIRDIYQAAATSSTTFAALKYDFGNSNISSSTKTWLPGTITILSTSTVTYYLSGSTLDLFNALVTAILWVSFLWVVFKRGKAALTPNS